MDAILLLVLFTPSPWVSSGFCLITASSVVCHLPVCGQSCLKQIKTYWWMSVWKRFPRKWGVKISSSCDVTESRSALWTQGSLRVTLLITWMKAETSDSMEWWSGGAAYQQIRASAGCVRESGHTQRVKTPKQLCDDCGSQTTVWWLQRETEWRQTKILIHAKNTWLSAQSGVSNIFSTLFCPSCLFEPLLTKESSAGVDPVPFFKFKFGWNSMEPITV